MKLNDIRVSQPCHASWNQMLGDRQARHCSECELKVYDLTAMSRGDAERIVASADRPCVRFVRRRDGSVVTKGKLWGLATWLAAAAALIVPALALSRSDAARERAQHRADTISALVERAAYELEAIHVHVRCRLLDHCQLMGKI